LNQTNPSNETLFHISILKSHIGETYRLMAQIDNQQENLERSIRNNSESLNIISSINCDISGLAFIKRNKGSLHISLSRIDNPLSPKDDPRYHLLEAINDFNATLPILKSCEYQYAETRNKLAMSQIWLSQTEPSWNGKKLVNNSSEILESSIEFYSNNKYSIDLAKTLNDQCIALCYRSRLTGSIADLSEALNISQIALKTLNLSELPLDCAETKWIQGMVYQRLAYLNKDKKNLERARDCYAEAIRTWKDNECTLDSAYAENILGNIYYDLSKISRKDSEDYFENLDNAKIAYEMALFTFTKEDYPEMHKIVEGNKKSVENPL